MRTYGEFQPARRLKATLAVSPDGTEVAYVDDRSGQFNVVVQPLAGGPARQLTAFVDSTVSRVAWHPDGGSLLFVADTRGDENERLYEVDRDGSGDPRCLTGTPGARFAPADEPYSPDGGRLAYVGNDREPGVQDVLVRDRDTGEVRRVFDRGGRMYAGYWSPDGNRLAVADWREGHSDHVVSVVRTDDGAVVRLTPEQGAAVYWLGPWLPDGSAFLVLSDAGRDFTGLALLDASTGAMTWLDTPDWDVEEVALSTDGRLLIWSVNVDGASQLRGREMSTGAPVAMPALPLGVASRLTITPDRRRLVLLLSTPDRPRAVVVLELAPGELRWLCDNRPSGVDIDELVRPMPIRYPAGDGPGVPALLYRPAGGQACGAVLAIHGGPPYQERPTYAEDGFFQFLAHHGVAVLVPNISGSTGYGTAYMKRSYRDWGGADLVDAVAGARYLQAQDWIDPGRVAVYGGSYGGFMVLSCISRAPEIGWAAAVDWCGPANLVTFARANPPTWRSKVLTMIGDPDTQTEFLMSRSPVTYADQIQAPLMVIQGENDPRVTRHESDQIVERLRARGVEVEYVLLPDEGHSTSKRSTHERVQSAAGEFLLAHLAPPTPPVG